MVKPIYRKVCRLPYITCDEVRRNYTYINPPENPETLIFGQLIAFNNDMNEYSTLAYRSTEGDWLSDYSIKPTYLRGSFGSQLELYLNNSKTFVIIEYTKTTD